MKEIIDFCYADKGKDAFYNTRHSHCKCYEFIFVCSGEGSFVVRDRIFPLQTACLYCIDGLETHCSIPLQPENYERHKLILNADFVDALAHISDCKSVFSTLFKNGGSCISFSEADVKYVNELFFHIKTALDKDDEFTKAHIAASILSLLACTSRNTLQAPAHADMHVTRILKYLNNNLSCEIRLDALCQEFYISKYYLCHLFKNAVGTSIFNYVLSRRLSNAKKMLILTDKPIWKIAIECGFVDFAYFSKIFKKQEGITPTYFRNLHRRT